MTSEDKCSTLNANTRNTAGAKDHAIRKRFGFSATTYFQILNRLLDDPEAAGLEPVLINGLRRLRDGQH